MLIQKVFHIRRPPGEAHARLSNSQNFTDWFWSLGGVARLANGRRFWDAISMVGFQGPFHLELLPTDDKHQVLFRSTGGGTELCGLMELLPVRDHLTEVQLTLEYEIPSPLGRALDRLLGMMNRRVNRQILEMRRQLDDDTAPDASAGFEPARLIPLPPLTAGAEPQPAR